MKWIIDPHTVTFWWLMYLIALVAWFVWIAHSRQIKDFIGVALAIAQDHIFGK